MATAKKLYDVSIEVGTYTDASGNKKKRSRKIGEMLEFQSNTGGTYVRLKLHSEILQPSLFTLARRAAGADYADDDSIMCGMWEPRDER